MDRAAQLGQGSIPRLLWAFSLPAMVGMVAQALYNIIDRIFIGRALGLPGIAGITVTLPPMLVFVAFGMLLGIGGAALVSIRLGEQNREGAERVLGNVVVLLLIESLVLTSVGLVFLDPLLRLFGASPEVLPYARDYAQIIVLGSICQTVGFSLNALIRGEGNPPVAMVTMLVSVLLNVLLAPLFIFGLGWGMRGAALATVLSQAASAGWVLHYFLAGRSLLRLRREHLALRWPVCRAILAIGSPPFVMQLAASVLNALMNRQLAEYGNRQIAEHGGDLAISVMGIIYVLAMMFAMPIFGINQGAQPIIGYNYGALRFDRVKKTLLTAALAASTISSAGFVVAMLLPHRVVQLFGGQDAALLAMGPHAIRIALLMWPIVGFQIVSAGYFQAVGKPRQAMLLSLSRQVLLLIPAMFVLPWFWGLDGVWAALPTADFGSSLWTTIWLALELRTLHQNHAEQLAQEPLAPSSFE